ncbi:mitochondrial 30S ribosomal protein S19 [Blastocladiella britannica]|nr:mitochondrial 30S ribosomal protein S19 [Blastocladiella britannica]
MRGTLPMLRSLWRVPVVTPFPELASVIANGGAIKTDHRARLITPDLIGVQFQIHNGNSYVPVTVTEDMVGHKLGEFAASKKWVRFKDSQKKRK